MEEGYAFHIQKFFGQEPHSGSKEAICYLIHVTVKKIGSVILYFNLISSRSHFLALCEE